ncbi:tRNA (adenosine(37)-N6)-dimethylallyltransferase MiaA [Limisphaera sp. VF-2]|jgi:tRNA dimethylallyltransferase|uniref:tRNA (adenosine(37)-N6)-dimethylallyltransferase MiaA n=1 Tax=Limisphaera sp. VF-2 TaxID=3400418 RepID=UPI001774B49B
MGALPDVSVVVLAGCTASGKSEVALELAERLDGEIVSVDSMQVYRGMDIGTAKPSPEERARVPHHLLDVVDPRESFDVARFVELAREVLADLARRGKPAILCGGTGLYFKALAQGLGEAPAPDPRLRAELEATPLADLLRELALRDPATYARIDRRNPRRVIRAVEVIRLTGQPFSDQRARWSLDAWPAHWQGRMFGLQRTPEDLRQRIEARVDRMFQAGLVEETRRLLDQGVSPRSTALQALGYRQVLEYLEGRRSLAETVALVKLRTRQFAKRQRTWFRGQMPLRWINVPASATPSEIADRILTELRREQ